jgi:cytochrome c553
MITRMHKKTTLLLGAATVTFTTLGCAMAMSAGSESSVAEQATTYRLNAQGELIRPTDYRRWVYVGTPVTPNDMNNGKAAFPEHHNVYIHPSSYDHYLETGKWEEGTILVKELVSVGTKAAVSGNGYFQGEFIGLEATVKSAKDFSDEPGNWAYFSFTNEEELGGDLKASAPAFETASCNACHAASAQDDFVFTQHYPVLRSAKGAKATPENSSRRPKTLGMVPGMGNGMDEITFDQSGRDETWKAMAPTPANVPGTEVPTGQQALMQYLQSMRYQQWEAKETQTHPSRGPHTNYGKPVRVFLNDTLAASMEAGNAEHPIGATAVKEMYEHDGTLAGWAVETKTHGDSASGDGWFWYEVTSTTDGSNPVAIGNGVSGCAGCHTSGGRDFVLSTYPLR